MAGYSWAEAVGKKLASRVAAGDAVWQRDVSRLTMPGTVDADGAVMPMGGVNALVCLQAMVAQGWTDARFLTASQVAGLGLAVRPEARSVPLQFWRTVDEEDGTRLDSPESVEFAVFNAADVPGLPAMVAVVKPAVAEVALLKVAEDLGLSVAFDQRKRAFVDREAQVLHSPPREEFSSDAQFCALLLHELGHGAETGRVVEGSPGDLSYAREELRAELASMWLSMALDVPHVATRHQGYKEAWAELLKGEPASWVAVAKEAEVMAATVLYGVRQAALVPVVEKVAELKGAQAGSMENASMGKQAMGKGSEWMRAKFEKRQAVLAVPFKDNKRAKEMGAVFFGAEKVWFVPEGVDMGPFKSWVASEMGGGQVANRAEVFDRFEKAMIAAGLDLPKKGVIDDGKWHNTRVTDKKGPNLSGSYVLNSDGSADGVPSGTIHNHYSGEFVHWRFDGPELTPEQVAAAKERALLREAKAAAELLKQHEGMASVASAIWGGAVPVGDGVGQHGYAEKKGIDASGFRVMKGGDLLKFDGWVGESGKPMVGKESLYLLVPMQDEAGKLWAVQAIDEAGRKSFMRGARKSGLFAVVGGMSVDEIEAAVVAGTVGKVAVGEGVATLASFADSAPGMPSIIAFDAGNMGKVAAALRKRLPEGVGLVVPADNDQFFVERALGVLADVGVVSVGAGAGGGNVVGVDRGDGVAREVALGDAVFDGAWHQAAKGRYRVMPEMAGALVKRVKVEVENLEGKVQSSVFKNVGVEAARAIAGAEVIVPVFADYRGKPTDFNDLAMREGATVVRQQVEAVVGKVAVVERSMSEARGVRR